MDELADGVVWFAVTSFFCVSAFMLIFAVARKFGK